MTISKTERDYLQALVNISGIRGTERATSLEERTIKKILKGEEVRYTSGQKLKDFLNELITTE